MRDVTLLKCSFYAILFIILVKLVFVSQKLCLKGVIFTVTATSDMNFWNFHAGIFRNNIVTEYVSCEFPPYDGLLR